MLVDDCVDLSTHALKTALHQTWPVFEYSAALASGWSRRTKSWHSAAVVAVVFSCVVGAKLALISASGLTP